MNAADLDPDEELALRGVYLSRLMFGWMLPPDLAYVETRSYEEFLSAAVPESSDAHEADLREWRENRAG